MDGGRAHSGSGSASGSGSSCPFLRRQSVKRSFSTMAEAEPRRSSSPASDSLFVSPDHHHRSNNDNAYHTHRPTTLALPPITRRTRFPGDGLDFRRPVTSAAGMGNIVIDLTEEDEDNSRRERVAPRPSPLSVTPEPGPSRARQRLPNFYRNIIDVESDGELEHGQESRGGPELEHHTHRHRDNHDPHQNPHPHLAALHHPHRASATMDEAAEARASRTLPPPWAGGAARNHGPAFARSITPHPTGSNAHSTTIDLTADDDDDVVVMEARARVHPQLNLHRPETTAGVGTFVDRVFGLAGAVFGGGAGGNRAVPAVHVAAAVPLGARAGNHPMGMITLDYGTVAFPIGDARPPTPKYEPPPAAAPGFTRSPKETDELVCPNCGDELCMGEDEIKQQVWVIKNCGHAYCGECAHNRGSAKKGKAKDNKGKQPATPGSAPMKKCQVRGCSATCTGKSMLRVYVQG